MNVYAKGEVLHISARNFREFSRLMEQAQKEARQLQETIDKLQYFDFTFGIEAREVIEQESFQPHPQ